MLYAGMLPNACHPLMRLALMIAVLSIAACGGDEGTDAAAVDADTAAVAAPGDTLGIFTDQSIVDVLRTDDRFSAFVAALDSSGLASVFEEQTPLTVFVPTNAAFGQGLLAPESRDRLRDVILYHALQQDLAVQDLQPGDTLTTLQGGDLAIALTDSQLTVNGVPITDPNVRARNGKIFVIDQALSPPAPTEF